MASDTAGRSSLSPNVLLRRSTEFGGWKGFRRMNLTFSKIHLSISRQKVHLLTQNIPGLPVELVMVSHLQPQLVLQQILTVCWRTSYTSLTVWGLRWDTLQRWRGAGSSLKLHHVQNIHAIWLLCYSSHDMTSMLLEVQVCFSRYFTLLFNFGKSLDILGAVLVSWTTLSVWACYSLDRKCNWIN